MNANEQQYYRDGDSAMQLGDERSADDGSGKRSFIDSSSSSGAEDTTQPDDDFLELGPNRYISSDIYYHMFGYMNPRPSWFVLRGVSSNWKRILEEKVYTHEPLTKNLNFVAFDVGDDASKARCWAYWVKRNYADEVYCRQFNIPLYLRNFQHVKSLQVLLDVDLCSDIALGNQSKLSRLLRCFTSMTDLTLVLDGYNIAFISRLVQKYIERQDLGIVLERLTIVGLFIKPQLCTSFQSLMNRFTQVSHVQFQHVFGDQQCVGQLLQVRRTGEDMYYPMPLFSCDVTIQDVSNIEQQVHLCRQVRLPTWRAICHFLYCLSTINKTHPREQHCKALDDTVSFLEIDAKDPNGLLWYVIRNLRNLAQTGLRIMAKDCTIEDWQQTTATGENILDIIDSYDYNILLETMPKPAMRELLLRSTKMLRNLVNTNSFRLLTCLCDDWSHQVLDDDGTHIPIMVFIINCLCCDERQFTSILPDTRISLPFNGEQVDLLRYLLLREHYSLAGAVVERAKELGQPLSIDVSQVLAKTFYKHEAVDFVQELLDYHDIEFDIYDPNCNDASEFASLFSKMNATQEYEGTQANVLHIALDNEYYTIAEAFVNHSRSELSSEDQLSLDMLFQGRTALDMALSDTLNSGVVLEILETLDYSVKDEKQQCQLIDFLIRTKNSNKLVACMMSKKHPFCPTDTKTLLAIIKNLSPYSLGLGEFFEWLETRGREKDWERVLDKNELQELLRSKQCNQFFKFVMKDIGQPRFSALMNEHEILRWIANYLDDDSHNDNMFHLIDGLMRNEPTTVHESDLESSKTLCQRLQEIEQQQFPLHLLLFRRPRPYEVQAELDKDATGIDLRNTAGDTPLHIAVKNEDEEIITLLFKYGANPSITDSKGRTPKETAPIWMNGLFYELGQKRKRMDVAASSGSTAAVGDKQKTAKRQRKR